MVLKISSGTQLSTKKLSVSAGGMGQLIQKHKWTIEVTSSRYVPNRE